MNYRIERKTQVFHKIQRENQVGGCSWLLKELEFGEPQFFCSQRMFEGGKKHRSLGALFYPIRQSQQYKPGFYFLERNLLFLKQIDQMLQRLLNLHLDRGNFHKKDTQLFEQAPFQYLNFDLKGH